jgi:hypothetical protein
MARAFRRDRARGQPNRAALQRPVHFHFNQKSLLIGDGQRGPEVDREQ